MSHSRIFLWLLLCNKPFSSEWWKWPLCSQVLWIRNLDRVWWFCSMIPETLVEKTRKLRVTLCRCPPHPHIWWLVLEKCWDSTWVLVWSNCMWPPHVVSTNVIWGSSQHGPWLQEQVSQGPAHGDCQFLKFWAWKPAQIHFCVFYWSSNHRIKTQWEGDIDSTFSWEKWQGILEPYLKTVREIHRKDQSLTSLHNKNGGNTWICWKI